MLSALGPPALMSGPKFGVVVFPGSNCDHDVYYALKHGLDQDTRFLWHKDSSIGDVDVVILPGGFSYGDYLRCGAIARFSVIMQEVVSFAHRGGVVVGICNGFQILCEAGRFPAPCCATIVSHLCAGTFHCVSRMQARASRI